MYQELLVALALVVFGYLTITESRAERKRWRVIKERQEAGFPPYRVGGYFNRRGQNREVDLYENAFGLRTGRRRDAPEVQREVMNNHIAGYGSVGLGAFGRKTHLS